MIRNREVSETFYTIKIDGGAKISPPKTSRLKISPPKISRHKKDFYPFPKGQAIFSVAIFLGAMFSVAIFLCVDIFGEIHRGHFSDTLIRIPKN
jgi:uncharacterized RDD family membrane protein YckC